MSWSELDGHVGYLAPEDFLANLREELGDVVSDIHGRLVLTKGPAKPVAWAANVWCDPMRIPISSIGDAAKKLRALQRNWALYSFASHRRAALISAKLPKVSSKPIVFGAGAPKAR
jgi:23S rRNA (cytidine2498-2'-O)-methyltransferase